MITECMNPECRKELHYLRSGRVVRVVHHEQEQLRVEHFWLCGDCHVNYDFRFSGESQVLLTRRTHVAVAEKPSLVLTLVA
jgi:hypothetical protein